jgi:hypothetical protein
MKMTLFWCKFSHQLLDGTKKGTFFEEKEEDMLCMIVMLLGCRRR